MAEKYFLASEMGVLLRISTKQVRLLIERGKINAVNVGSDKMPRWRISESDYTRFLANEMEERQRKDDD